MGARPADRVRLRAGRTARHRCCRGCTIAVSASSALGLIPVVLVLAVLGMDLWLYADAKAHSNSGTPVVFSNRVFVVNTPEAWFVGSLLPWVIFIPLYFSSRNQRR